MKNTLVVVADLACFKAYRLDNNHPNQSPRLNAVGEFTSPAAHSKLVDTVTDLAGRFPRSTGGPGRNCAMSDGERHNIELEARKRQVRQMAQRINVLLRDPEIDCCFLAASREISTQLLDELEPQARAKITKSVPADLTKIERAQIMRHF